MADRPTPSGRSVAVNPAAPASVAARPSTRGADANRPDTYTVKPGDTLYSIALEHGLDYRELAIWNGLDNPAAVRVGMQMRLSAPAGAAVAMPLKSAAGTVDARALGAGQVSATPLPPSPSGAATGPVLTEPKGVRMPYSDQALAQLSQPQAGSAPVPRAEAPRVEGKAEAKTDPGNEGARGPDDVDWGWPAKGKVIVAFNDSTNKGISIAGKLGQPVLASAPGRVIFSGTGIRGFGKLIVIKHNETYLSVYAHNSELSVKEGQTIAKGQKIAEMGNTDADQVKLHFEIRRFGKPVDPAKLLPAG